MAGIKEPYKSRLETCNQRLHSGAGQLKRFLTNLQQIPTENGKNIEKFVKMNVVPLTQNLKNDFHELESTTGIIRNHINKDKETFSSNIARLQNEGFKLNNLLVGSQNELTALHQRIRENDKKYHKVQEDIKAAEKIFNKFKAERDRFRKTKNPEILMQLSALLPGTHFIFGTWGPNIHGNTKLIEEAFKNSQAQQEAKIKALNESFKNYQDDTNNRRQRIKQVQAKVDREIPDKIKKVQAEKSTLEAKRGNLLIFEEDVKSTDANASLCHFYANSVHESFMKMTKKKSILGKPWLAGVKSGTEILKAVIENIQHLVNSFSTLAADKLISNNTIQSYAQEIRPLLENIKRLTQN